MLRSNSRGEVDKYLAESKRSERLCLVTCDHKDINLPYEENEASSSTREDSELAHKNRPIQFYIFHT